MDSSYVESPEEPESVSLRLPPQAGWQSGPLSSRGRRAYNFFNYDDHRVNPRFY